MTLTTSTNLESATQHYVDDLNAAIEHRDFASVFAKWFAADGELIFRHETAGLAKTRQMWSQLVPTQEAVTRQVLQFPYRVDGNVVFTWRELSGGNLPRTLYALQQTRFDEHTLIEDVLIESTEDKPVVEIDEDAATCRLGRIFLQFADCFNVYFRTADVEPIMEWISPNIHALLDNSLRGVAVVQHYERIPPDASLVLQDSQQVGSDRVRARVGYVTKGTLYGSTASEFVFDAEERLRQVILVLTEQ